MTTFHAGPLCRRAFYILLIFLVVISLYPRLHTPFVPTGGDKIGHFAMYCVLAVPAVLGWPARRRLLLLALPLLGLALEIGQIPIPGRGFEWADAVANTAGALTGVVLVSSLLWLANRRIR